MLELAREHFRRILKEDENPVLFIVDMQESSVARLRDKISLVSYQCELVRLFIERKLTVVASEYGETIGSTVVDLLSLLTPYENFYRFRKNKVEAYNELYPIMRKVNSRTVVMVGIYASKCIITNATLLKNKGKFKVIICEKGIADYPFQDKSKIIKEFLHDGHVVI